MFKNFVVFTLTVMSFVSFSEAQIQMFRPQSDSLIDKDDEIVPEGLSGNLNTLLHEWQLEFSSADKNCRQGLNVVFHDSVYMNRLYNLPTVMEMSYNEVVRSYIDRYSDRNRNMVGYLATIGDYYFPMFEQALDKYGLPLELKYLPVIESALNPIAVSRVGATGLWQFMLKTGQSYGLEVNSLVDERRDPHKATDAAARYLLDLHKLYEDWNLVIAAYNCGPGNVNKAISRSGGKRDYWEIYKYLPKETRGYVPAFIAATYIMNYYPSHNICAVESNNDMIAMDTIHVNKQLHFKQISDVLSIPMEKLRRMNPQYKMDIIPGGVQSYVLVLPTNKVLAFIEQQDTITNYNRDTFFTHRLNTDQYINSSYSSNVSSGGTQNVYYKVKKGDNLGKIAQRNHTTVAQLKKWNNLKSNMISAGKSLIVQKKVVPVDDETIKDEAILADNASTKVSGETKNIYYKIKKGDSLSEIADRFGTSVNQLKAWNNLKSNRIDMGKSLIVKKESVPIIAEKLDDSKTQETKVDSTNNQSDIISAYLNNQLKGADIDSTAIKGNVLN
ncbi:MAG: LysM peptidoglycan-binding domain-containing protein [Dysgonamonadaceae bacterium]|nr:LysM peptidoglycan-binding domain-containing protein [Dysgonamonadaceae bacterium]MDD3308885.1 LysM peptidoglycan-binding domain-containing protein [Dysgonamonadaceae bacterium]MDD3900397.1 LysM peptidoglycan-binding domain-containing protein [Dysgonamonadaceae bacterium]MDD4398241.1 LysM peptidoglycan-binding domain-containing protein [Dysgonamonadaceae bacterium]